MSINNKLSILVLLLLVPMQLVLSGSNPKSNTKKVIDPDIFKSVPFLQNPFNGNITISWFTTKLTHGWVEIGETKKLGQKRETRIGGQTVANVKHHKVKINNLTPGKKYYYRVASREILAYGAYNKKFGETIYSKIYSFTLPDNKSDNFTAIIFNDLHKHKKTISGLMKQVSNTDYDFVLFNGDCVDDPMKEEDATSFINFANKEVNASEKPVIYIRGNHEIRGAYSVGLNDILDYPGGKTYGAFNWGDTRFVVLDCGEDKPDSHPVYGELNSFEQLRNDQVTFLKKEIKSKKYKKASERILIHHIPLYLKKGKYAPCKDLWEDILNKGKITVAINAHTHKFAYHKTNSLGNKYPIVVGGGYKEKGATVMILTKKKKSTTLKVLGFDGKVLGEYKL